MGCGASVVDGVEPLATPIKARGGSDGGSGGLEREQRRRRRSRRDTSNGTDGRGRRAGAGEGEEPKDPHHRRKRKGTVKPRPRVDQEEPAAAPRAAPRAAPSDERPRQREKSNVARKAAASSAADTGKGGLRRRPEPVGVEEPDWRALAADPGELARRACAYFMARTPGTPGALDPQVRLEVGRQALLSLRSTLAGAGLTRGDAATLPHIEQFCSWLQSAFFDTITTDEHGPELRQQARLLNQQIEGFLQDPRFQDADAGAAGGAAAASAGAAAAVLPPEPALVDAAA